MLVSFTTYALLLQLLRVEMQNFFGGTYKKESSKEVISPSSPPQSPSATVTDVTDQPDIDHQDNPKGFFITTLFPFSPLLNTYMYSCILLLLIDLLHFPHLFKFSSLFTYSHSV